MFRAVSILIMFFLQISVFALDIEPRPDGARFSFSAPSGTVFIDIYVDDVFQARLDGKEKEYEAVNLLSNKDYKVSLAYRRSDNSDISAEFGSFSTTNWDGLYRWVNNTDKDNGGRVREIEFIVRTVNSEKYGQYNEVYMLSNSGRKMRLFPLFDLGTAVGWVDYEGESDAAVVYRENAERFNKTSMDPSSWTLTKMEVSPSYLVSYVDTKAFGFTIPCTTSFQFNIDENGEKEMVFLVTGPSILKSFYFSCPDAESEDGEFILKQM